MESESEIGEALEIFSRNQNISLTPFSNFVASQTVSNKEENISFIHESFRISGKEKTDEVRNNRTYLCIKVHSIIISYITASHPKYKSCLFFCSILIKRVIFV